MFARLLAIFERERLTHWLEQELLGCKFTDERLEKRFKTLCKQLWNGIGCPIPFACQDWANTKAAYRFFSNNRIDEKQILNGHFESTKEQFSKTEGFVLVLQDTTEFSYERERPQAIGFTKILPSPVKNRLGKPKRYTKCGILMHSSLVVTPEGLPS